MKKNTLNLRNLTWVTIACLFLSMFSLVSCDEDETYGEKKERERATIKAFLTQGICLRENTTGDTILNVPPINYITEEKFIQQDSTTDLERNEYVLLPKTGIYMQIVRKGSGQPMGVVDTATVLCRFMEVNLQSDTVQASNMSSNFIAVPDVLSCYSSYGNYQGSFVSGVMRTMYGSTTVPEGWLVPLDYINLGRYDSEDSEIAKVRLIVPHSSNHSLASENVYACFYEISYQRGR